MKLSLIEQALILDFIYDAGWVNREGKYYDYITYQLTPNIEGNISEALGHGWKVKEAYRKLKIEELKREVRSRLREKSRALKVRNGNTDKRNRNRFRDKGAQRKNHKSRNK